MIERLLILQDRDRRIAQLIKEQGDIPAREEQIESRLNKQKEAIRQAQEEIKKKNAASKQLDVEIESRKDKIKKFREQQFLIKSNQEYRALEHEISVVQKEIRELEDKELELMESIDGVSKSVAQIEKELAQEGAGVQEDLKALKNRGESILGEIEELKTDRAELAKDINPDWLSRYERIMNKVGDFAIVRVENSACGGCHMNLPPQLIHDSRKNLSIVECSFCSRILYWQP